MPGIKMYYSREQKRLDLVREREIKIGINAINVSNPLKTGFDFLVHKMYAITLVRQKKPGKPERKCVSTLTKNNMNGILK
jgi:hypothetical protein